MKVKRKLVRSIYALSVFLLMLLAIGCAQIEAYEVIAIILIVVIISTISVVNLGKLEGVDPAKEEESTEIISEQ